MVSFTLWPLYSQEGTPVSTELEGGRGGGGLGASLDILKNRITLYPARNHAKDHPVHSLLTYGLSYPNSNRSYIINICVNAGHHNRQREVRRGSICDTSTCDHFRFSQCCCLIRVCYVVSCDGITIRDELGRK
jgi:hypothetical protein